MSPAGAPWACPPEGTFLTVLDAGVEDSCLFNRSISAACDLMVSFSSPRTEDDSFLLMLILLWLLTLLLMEVFLTNASNDGFFNAETKTDCDDDVDTPLSTSNEV